MPAAVQRRFARNAAHVAVRDALQAVGGPTALIRNYTAQARIHMTRGWDVESGGSTSCEWKEGGECSLLSARKLPDGPRGGQVGLTSLPKAAATLAGNVFRCISRQACELVLQWR